MSECKEVLLNGLAVIENKTTLTKILPLPANVANGFANERNPCFKCVQVSDPPVAQFETP